MLIATPIWLVSAATQYAVVFGLYGDIQLRFNGNLLLFRHKYISFYRGGGGDEYY